MSSITLLSEPSPAKINHVDQDRIRVYWQASYWNADIFMQNIGDRPLTILPGQSVMVVGRRSNKLIVLMSKYP